MRARSWLGALVGALLCVPAVTAEPARLVFGSFDSRTNAERWAVEVTTRTQLATEVVAVADRYRVATRALDADLLAAAATQARAAGLEVWRVDEPVPVVAALPPEAPPTPPPEPEPLRVTEPPTPAVAPTPPRVPHPLTGVRLRQAAQATSSATPDEWTHDMDLDVGFQTRSYAYSGLDGQSRFQPSVSASYRYRGALSRTDAFTFTPFVRYDAEDDERTHADVRELYWSRVGADWDLHVGVKQVFWGVTEFKHLIDVINQTDFVENVDGEDKLGQPMVNLSVVRDWGIVDLFVLPGFRERTYPGEDGRLRFAYPVDDDAEYERGAGEGQVDFAVRWSHRLGPVEWGLYQFEGTGRDPKLVPELRAGGDVVLRPHYDAVDQTGLDAQAILGDWALKLEAMSRRAFGERFNAAVAGFERTIVGFVGRTDLGIVVEYMYDQRGEDAYDTVLERDVAVGTRWRLNDVADTQALFGFIWDTDTDEYMLQLEASRRLGDSWALILESRVFGGAKDDPFDTRDGAKTAAFQRDDYVQIELTRFF